MLDADIEQVYERGGQQVPQQLRDELPANRYVTPQASSYGAW